jgi:hypothetical protein
MKKLDLEIDGEKYSFLLKTKKLRKRNSWYGDLERRQGDLEATIYKGHEMKKETVKGTFAEISLDSPEDYFSHTFELNINYVGKTNISVTESNNDFHCGIIVRNGYAKQIKKFSIR